MVIYTLYIMIKRAYRPADGVSHPSPDNQDMRPCSELSEPQCFKTYIKLYW